MSDALDAPLREFYSDLQRLGHLLDLIKTLRDFGSTVPPDTAPKEVFGENAQKVHSSIRSLSQDFPVLAGTLLLYLAGRFENFVRNAFESVCDTYAAKCTTFDELREKMKQSLISSTAAILATPGRYGFDHYTQVYSFIVNLSTNIQAKAGLGPINSVCLSITDHNMNAKMGSSQTAPNVRHCG